MTSGGALSERATAHGLTYSSRFQAVPLNAAQLDQLARYRDLLLDWNRRVNLTAIADPEQVERRLFLDALLMLPAVDEAVSRARSSPLRVVDIGSGAGFPGLPLKIARPELDVTLVEATGKKVTFLQRVIAELRLEGATAIHARAETIGHDPAHRARYDLATARAVAALPTLLEFCVPLLRDGGRALFPKGLEFDQELAAGRRAAPLVGARIVGADRLPESDTRLVIVDRIGPTPQRYPRRAGLPAHDPLGGDAP